MSSFVENLAHFIVIGHARLKFTVLEHTHYDRTTTVSSCMLSKVIASRELLATLIAFEGLVLGMERPVVTLQVLLSSESSGAKIADKSFAGILSKGLLSATSVGWC